MNKIDIIIPTYNRTELLKRVLDYYQQFGNDFHFIIADSSSPRNKKRNHDLVKSYLNLDILYIDKFSPKLAQSRKFQEIVKYAKNRYCLFCADDDFVVPNAIRKSVDFLEKHPDYTTAHGTYIGFYLFKNILGSSKFWWKFRDNPINLTDSDPLKRLSSHLKNYTLVNFAVRRTEVVKFCYREYSKVDLDPYLTAIIGELIPDCLTVISGKVKNINTLYGARQYFGSILSYYPTFHDAKKNGLYQSEYGKFKNSLIKNISQKYNIPKEKSDAVIDSSMENYLIFSYQEYFMNKINLNLRNFPKIFSQALRLLHSSYLFSKAKKSSLGIISQSSSKYFKDFYRINQSVLQSKI